jgi:trimeric autotransporter adhesin
VYVAATDSDSIAIFNRDPKTGRLVSEQVMRGAGLDGASDIRFSADGQFAYVASEIADNLVVYARTASTGRLSHVQTFSKGGGVGLEGPFSVTLSKDGQRVFVASHVIGEVSIFARDASTGRVEFLQVLHNGIDGVEGVAGAFSAAPSPEGKFLYVTGTTEDSLAVFSLNEHASQPVKKKK